MIGLPGFPSTTGLTPRAARRFASSSALVGNNFFPDAAGAVFLAPLFASANFLASNSALVGKR